VSARAYSILDAIKDERLFGAAFKNLETWRAWMAFLSGLFALPMSEEQAAIFRQCTGRDALPSKAFSEAWIIAGRRSGKSFVLALIATFLGCFRNYQPYLGPGEKAVIEVIAADRKQAKQVLRFVRGLLSVPVLMRRIVSDTADSIELEGSAIIEVVTASHAVRGFTCAACLVDELAFFPSDDASTSGAEIIAALRPTMLTIPNALMICASSPYSRAGPLWDAFRRHHAVDGSPILVWKAATTIMNPSVPQGIVDQAYEDDPISAAAEFGAEFRSDVQNFVDHETVRDCVSIGVRERPPGDFDYGCFIDPSGGSSDSMTLAIGHREGDMVVVDCLREVRPPFSPDDTCAQFAALMKSYRVTRATGDKYGGLWPTERFAAHDVTYEACAEPKSSLYQNMLPLLNAKRLDLLDSPRLMAQICGLERRVSRAGRDSIDHGPTGHDDIANAVAGCASVLASASSYWANDLAWVGEVPDVSVGPAINPAPSIWGHPALQGVPPWLR
jgi:hypothetical protein